MVSFGYCLIGHLSAGSTFEFIYPRDFFRYCNDVHKCILYNEYCENFIGNHYIYMKHKLDQNKLCTYAIPTLYCSEIKSLSMVELDAYSLLEENYRGMTNIPECEEKIKYKCLENEIRKINILKYLFLEYPNDDLSRFIFLQKLIVLTSEYNFFENYIDYYLEEYPELINYQNLEGDTLLMKAVMNTNKLCSEKTLKILLKHNPNINLLNSNETSALMLASMYSNKNSTLKTVEILLNYDADVNLQNKYGITALMLASSNSKTTSSDENVELLLNSNANINIKDNNGNTALMYASSNFKSKSTERTIKLLLKFDADISLQNKNLDSAFTLSIKDANIYERDIIKLLLSKMELQNVISNGQKIKEYFSTLKKTNNNFLEKYFEQ